MSSSISLATWRLAETYYMCFVHFIGKACFVLISLVSNVSRRSVIPISRDNVCPMKICFVLQDRVSAKECNNRLLFPDIVSRDYME